MLLLEPETPTYRGYLHEVNTHLDHLDISVDEDIANAHGDIGGRILDFLEITLMSAWAILSRVKTNKKAGIESLIRLGTCPVPRPKE